jgi:hypothetical protein
LGKLIVPLLAVWQQKVRLETAADLLLKRSPEGQHERQWEAVRLRHATRIKSIE